MTKKGFRTPIPTPTPPTHPWWLSTKKSKQIKAPCECYYGNPGWDNFERNDSKQNKVNSLLTRWFSRSHGHRCSGVASFRNSILYSKSRSFLVPCIITARCGDVYLLVWQHSSKSRPSEGNPAYTTRCPLSNLAFTFNARESVNNGL